jgi:hypothetical protein
MIEGVPQDLMHGARMLVKNPGFTFVAIVSIGTGMPLASSPHSRRRLQFFEWFCVMDWSWRPQGSFWV